MLNVERLATAPIGIQKRMRLEFDDYIYSSSPPRFSIAGLVIPKRIDFYSGNFFEQVDSSPPPSPPHLLPAQSDESDGDVSPPSGVESRPSPTLRRGLVDRSSRSHKRVYFADEVGKRLAEVCTYSGDSGEEADCPADAIERRDHPLHRGTTLNGTRSLFDVCPSLRDAFSTLSVSPLTYRPEFVQPVSNFPIVTERLERNGVCLEYANLAADDRTRIPTLTGKILVRRGEAAQVFLRCTTDGWKSQADVEARHVTGLSAGGFETHSFSVELFRLCRLSRPRTEEHLSTRYPAEVEFAVSCQQPSGVQRWDNNDGANYKFSRQQT